MKNKAILPLIETAVMLLVFALAAAICLNAFSQSKQISDANRDRDTATLLARNTAEALKSADGDYEKTAAILGANGVISDCILELRFDGNGQPTSPEDPDSAVYLVTVAKGAEDPTLKYYENAVVRVTKIGKPSDPLIELPVAWSNVCDDKIYEGDE